MIWRKASYPNRGQRTNKVTATNDEQKLPGEMDELQLFTIGGTSKPFCANLAVNDKLTMEIETGAAVSIITEQTFERSILNYPYKRHTSF